WATPAAARSTSCAPRPASWRSRRRECANRTCTTCRSSRKPRITASNKGGVHDRILILDFGAQYTQLIARRVREGKVYSEIHPCDVSDAFVREFAPKGVILSGSHLSAYEEATEKAPKAVFELGVPVLGICYGMQTMA